MDRPAPIELDELLRHRRFLQALVRGMIADEEGVEDVLQDTWLKALERPPRSLGSLKSWLGRVARNAALNRIRTARRGTAREERAARPELVSTTALDTAQKLERQQQVLAAVMRLREPRRTTIHMRYFEDRAPAEIASELGVSVNTVNDRLRRGREELRRDLERSLGSELGSHELRSIGLWMLPLAGLSKSATAALQAQLAATAAAGTIATTSIAPPLLGGLVMSKKVLVAAVILFAAAGLWWTFGAPRSTPAGALERNGVAAATEAPGRSPVAEETEPAEIATPAPRREAAIPEEPLSVRVRAVDRQDAALAGVQVRVRLWQGYEPEGEALVDELLETGPDGELAWRPRRPEGALVVAAAPADEGHVGYGDQALVLPGAEPRVLLVSAYPIDVTVTGFVRDGEGRPIAGAEVRCYATATTDAEGRYSLPASRQAVGLAYASAPGFSQERAMLEFAPGPETRLDFELSREFRITGRVTDERGAPVEGVELTTFYSNSNVAHSDADGRYELGHLDPARDRHLLYGRKEGYVLASATVDGDPDMLAEADLVMRVGTRVEGRVVDEHGRALPGAALYIGFSPNAYDRLDAVSRDDGTFEFPHVESGERTLGTHLDGFAPDLKKLQIPEGASAFGPVEVVLREGRTVAGFVLDPDDEPVANVLVHAMYQDDWIEPRTRTDAEGAFELAGLPATDTVLAFYLPGYVRLREPLPDGEVGELEVVLPRSGELAGRVVDGVTGEPLPEFKIRLVQAVCDQPVSPARPTATWVREGHSFSATDGYWDIGKEILDPGTYVGVEASAPGYAAAVEPCVLIQEEADPDALVLRLFAGRRLTGRVLDAGTGLPLEGAVVKRYLNDVASLLGEPYDVQLASTDANGEFVLVDVPPGQTRLTIEHARWKRSFRDGPFEVAEQGDTYREIRIGGGARITGTVADAGGQRLAGARIELEGEVRSVVGPYRETTTSDADGTFAFEDLPDGAYMISRAAEGRPVPAFRLAVFVADGRSFEVELAPPRGSSIIEGTLESDRTIPDEVPLWVARIPEGLSSPRKSGGVPVLAEALPSWSAIARGGSFRFEGLPEGTYQVIVEHRDDVSGASVAGTAQVDVAAGGRAELIVPVRVR